MIEMATERVELTVLFQRLEYAIRYTYLILSDLTFIVNDGRQASIKSKEIGIILNALII
jgi:hypothetical protein